MLDKPKIITDWEEQMPKCCFTCISFQNDRETFCNYFNEEIPHDFTSEINACDKFMSFKECPF